MVELLLGMLAASIMALAVGSILYYAWVSWVQSNAAVEMQRDASLSMRIIAKEVRRTPVSGITDGTSLTCVNTGGSFTFLSNGNNLDMQFGGGQSVTLARNVLAYFNATVSNRAVVVELNLSTGSDTSENRMTIFTRN
jgi:hypothetical protein